MDLDLYRGVFLPKPTEYKAINSMRQNGIVGDEGKLIIPVSIIHCQVDKLFALDNLSTSDTRVNEHSSQMVCACGDEQGAAYYALEHNYKRNIDGNSYIITLEVPVNN